MGFCSSLEVEQVDIKKQLKEIAATKAELVTARAAYHNDVHSALPARIAEHTQTIKVLRGRLSALICAGAEKCPDCESGPIGLEQPRPDGKSSEYEVGCPRCGLFEFSEGDVRSHSARGGTLPHHAVEAWNAGPHFWQRASADKAVAFLAAKAKQAGS